MAITTDLDARCIDTIRTLCIDAIQAASSGHPGTPLGIAPLTYTLWQRYLRFDPADPIWPNRDRYVLSSGHASALLWSMLHLTGVKAVDPDYEIPGDPAVSLDDLRRFRQLDSKAPGHPEYRWTSGVEATTGPLGTGVATSVGMAAASQWLGARYNRDGHTLFDFDVYAQAGDGCMMEGIASEAASFAAHQRLWNLCWIYDSNRVTIEGHTDITFTEDVAARFVAYGWNVTSVADANDLEQIARALHDFHAEHERPTLIVARSHIGYGTEVEDTAKAHGEPLGPEGVKAAKRFYGWPEDARFLVPEGVYEHFAEGIGARGRKLREAWEAAFEEYRAAYPELAEEIERMQRRELPRGWDADLPEFPADENGIASRSSSGEVLNAVAKNVPWLLGGAADVAPSTKTHLAFDGAGELQVDNRAGRNFHFGVRENASAAIANGLAVSKLRPFWSAFLIFSDFARGAIRLSALMEIPVIHIFTHDSIGVGEDGPTHQPVEQLASLRAIPGLLVFRRPGDANEVAQTWRYVMQLAREPAVLILSRQNLPTLDRSVMTSAAGVANGAYVLLDADDRKPDVILIATGSEVALAVAAREELAAEGIGARVVSMPCCELFDRQPQSYRDEVLPPSVKARVAIEQASTLGWHRYVGDGGAIVGMHTFGASAPLKMLIEKFGFTPDAVTQVARECVAAARSS
ncbi:MAG: transketolase [Gammaproteobacteria bacterium]|nr:transketolase [Gammaproteobacteria bacterium]